MIHLTISSSLLLSKLRMIRSAAKMIAETGSRFEKKRLEREMKSISRFFLGDWYLLLSGRDNGPQILERLDQEVFKND